MAVPTHFDVRDVWCRESILGRDIEEVIDQERSMELRRIILLRMVTAMLNGLIIEVENGKSNSVERLSKH